MLESVYRWLHIFAITYTGGKNALVVDAVPNDGKREVAFVRCKFTEKYAW